MPRDADKTRERIVEAAARLFYVDGIRAVSVDAVAEAAGVTKKTVYYHFRSKDDLIAAYLDSQDQPVLALYRRWFEETEGSVADRIRGLFDRFARAADRPKWNGCGFLRTTAELANFPGHPAVKSGARHKRRFEAWLEGEMEKAGVANAGAVARKLLVLLDGSATVMLIHRDPEYVRLAGEAAADIVGSAMVRP